MRACSRQALLRSLFIILVLLLWMSPARAQQGKGFALDRYEPTPAGQWSFAVDHPWFSRGPSWVDGFAAGLTLDYSHDPMAATSGASEIDIVKDQLVGHFDLAFALFNRAEIDVSLPLTFYEGGTAAIGVAPVSGKVGDVRVGLAVRLWKDPMRDPFSLSLAGDLWIPVGTAADHAGDTGVRGSPRLVLAGLGHHVMWAVNAAYVYAPVEQLGLVRIAGNYAASEMRYGASIGYASLEHRFEIGPEATYAVQVSGPTRFTEEGSSLELLFGGNYNIAHTIELGAAGGMGLLNALGTPEARVLLRLAYAPMHAPKKAAAPVPPADRDGDGIADAEDACPDVPGVASSIVSQNGCPSTADTDHDGVPDRTDQCPQVAAGKYPDAKRRGCPMADADRDGVPDVWDHCPNEPAGAHPDPGKPGCPAKDSDGDGVYDFKDMCPNAPAGAHPDPKRAGCPLSDRDQDGVPDTLDACPDQFGVTNADPKKNGCPALAQVVGKQIKIGEPIRFRSASSRLLPVSDAVLQSVADALAAHPEIKHLTIEGYTDSRGSDASNQELSERRANSVRSWLVEHGVDRERLSAKGFGEADPVASNDTLEGRALNRRVEFHIDKQDK